MEGTRPEDVVVERVNREPHESVRLANSSDGDRGARLKLGKRNHPDRCAGVP